MYLPEGTRLHNRYVIEAVLGVGGFGVTYLAMDTLLNVKVAVKEYLPRQLATRGEGQTQVTVFTGEAQNQYEYGLKKFLEEAQALAQFAAHPNIVTCNDFFAENGTAYLVMHYIEGITLKEYLAQQGGRIPFETALGIMMPVMDALREVHQANLLHRDISPDNIFLTTGNQVKVIDFGAARYQAGEHSKSLSVILKPGYAPEEQYRSSGRQGPWTDVYAVAATMYKVVTGQNPPEALDRLADDTLMPPSRLGVAIPPGAEEALLRGLAVLATQRFQSMPEFQGALTGQAMAGEFNAAGPPGPQPHFAGPDPLTRKVRQTSWATVAPWVLLGLLVAGGAMYQFLPGQKTPGETKKGAPPQLEQTTAPATAAKTTAESAPPVNEVKETGEAESSPSQFGELPQPSQNLLQASPTLAAVPVNSIHITSSSVLPASTAANYQPKNVLDGKATTAWVEGALGPGIGEWIRMNFQAPQTIGQIEITNGYGYNREIFTKNNRVKGAQLSFSDGGSLAINLADHNGPQLFTFVPVNTTFVQLQITSVYSGTKWDDTCISEIRVFQVPEGNMATAALAGRQETPSMSAGRAGANQVPFKGPTERQQMPNGYAPPPPPVPAVPQVRRDFPRMWRVEWRWGRNNALYAGTLAINGRLNDQTYTGVMTIRAPNNQVVSQNAVVSVNGAKVVIRCSNPSLATYPTDNFYLDLRGNTMTGIDKDAKGNIAHGVTFVATTP